MEEIKFEVALKRLEEIVSKLEAGDSDLDTSVALFQEGIELVKKCENKLKDVEEKSVKIIEDNKEKDFDCE